MLFAFGHCHRFVEALDCCVNLLDYWSWFGFRGFSHNKGVNLFHGNIKNAKQKSRTDKKSLEITGGCVCEREGADLSAL